MRSRCNLIDHSFSPDGKMRITLELEERRDIADLAEKVLDLDLKVYREKRSLQANRLFWHCIGELAKYMRADKDEIHDLMLRRYGTFTYQIIKPKKEVFDRLAQCWEGIIEDRGEIYNNGIHGRQILMIYPSRFYNTEEFSRLLDGVLDDMKQAGIETPEEARIKAALEEYEEAKPWKSQSCRKTNTAKSAEE